MNYRNYFRKLSIFFFTIIMISYGLSAFAGNPSEFVLTITSPVSEGVNGSKVLFDKLKLLIGEVYNKASLASVIEKAGGNWSLTSEMSCVQLAILFPEYNDSIIDGIYNFVSEASQLNVLPANDDDKSSFSAIFANCATKCDWNWNETISFYSNGLPKSFSNGLTSILASSTFKSDLFDSDKQWIDYLAVKGSEPMLTSILSWDKISINNYISAKIIGEKFLKTSIDNKLTEFGKFAEYRIWTLPGKLFLILSIKGSERVLYNNLQTSVQFCDLAKISSIAKSDDWKLFASSSKRILTEDMRDPMKAALYNGWSHHWTDESDSLSDGIPDEIKFVSPGEFQKVFIMPNKSLNETSYSDNKSVSFVGHKYNGSKELIDVVLALQSEQLPDLKNAFKNNENLVVPVTLKEVNENLLLVAFCADVDTMDAMIQSLYKRVNQLKLNTDTSLALVAVGKLAPFILKCRLQTHWKSLEQNHSWQNASEADIAHAIGVSVTDKNALSGRYLLKMSSSRGRAELLAILACQHKKLNIFTNYFK